MDKKFKVFCKNKVLRHNYFVLETYESGIVLSGYEVQAIRHGKCNLKENYVVVKDNEVYMRGCHISTNINDRTIVGEPTRDRKLLLHRREIDKLCGKVKENGLSLVVGSIYGNNGKLKAELCLVKGKHNYDKRRDIAEKDNKRKIERALKNR